MLLAVVVMAALVLIALAVAAPVVARDLRRDKEVESERRAQEYVRALQLYQRQCKCTTYPASMEALEKSNNIRFLRHQWIDPLTGKADWRILHNPQTTVKGFFGEELTGLAPGLGSAAGLASGGNTGTVSAGGLAGGFNGGTIGVPTSGTGTSPTAATGLGTSGPGSGGGGQNGLGSASSLASTGTGGIIKGVGTSRTGESIATPNEQTTYDTWEFQWDPRLELLAKGVNILGGGVPGSGSGGGGIGSTNASDFGQGLNGSPNGRSPASNPGGGGLNMGGQPGSSFPAGPPVPPRQ